MNSHLQRFPTATMSKLFLTSTGPQSDRQEDNTTLHSVAWYHHPFWSIEPCRPPPWFTEFQGFAHKMCDINIFNQWLKRTMVQKIQDFNCHIYLLTQCWIPHFKLCLLQFLKAILPLWLGHSHTNRCTQSLATRIHISAPELSQIMMLQSYSCQGPVYTFQRAVYIPHIQSYQMYALSTMITYLIAYKFLLTIYN